MKLICGVFLLVCLQVLFTACREEKYVYPDAVTEFADAHTDATGTLTRLVNDRNEEMLIRARSGLGGLTPDSVYRTLCVYTPVEEPQVDSLKEVNLFTLRSVIATLPVEAHRLVNGMKTDPLDIQSIWRGGDYINMILLPLVKDQPHAYYFVENGIVTHPDGRRTLHLALYHNRHGDPEAFTQKTYFSIPLRGYRGKLSEGDTIRLRLNTYKEGMTTRSFLY